MCLSKIKRSDYQNKFFLFGSLVILINILFWISAYLTRGAALSNYFLGDPHDTSMDYFHMLSNIPESSPYVHNANYPALPFVIWKFLYHFIPYNAQGTDGFFLRGYMFAQIGFMICTFVCLLALWEIAKYVSPEDCLNKCFFPISLVLSGPIMFTFERGNIIILAFIFTALYSLLYDNKKTRYRYIGYICLSIAVAIKIYPALYGLLTLNNRKYKETVHLIIIGIIVFFVPFFCFDGLKSLNTMIHGISMSSTDFITLGFGYNYSFMNLIRIIYGFAGSFKSNISLLTLIIPLCISTFIFLVNKDKWKKILSITLLIVWIPGFSYTYTLVFFFIPLFVFLKVPKAKLDIFYLICFVLIVSPFPFPKFTNINHLLGKEFQFYLTGGMLIGNIAIVTIAITLIVEGIIKLLKNR